MKPLQLYGPLPQAKTALDVLAMLADKGKRKEVFDALKAVEDERERLNEAIAVHGKAKKIDGLLHSASEKEEAAKRLLDDAGWEAADMRASAKKDMDEARAKVKLREDAVDAQKKALDERDTELTSALVAHEAELIEWAEKLKVKETKLSSGLAGLKERETKYRDRKKALEAIPAL